MLSAIENRKFSFLCECKYHFELQRKIEKLQKKKKKKKQKLQEKKGKEKSVNCLVVEMKIVTSTIKCV